ncbi:VOC family protein [Streptomyces sp. NPDC057638]|uniref:VOC family protein n=1 Tax=Streptomyces sp. NPDC057638 TaxID=3346190 RepID=UPI0036AE295B
MGRADADAVGVGAGEHHGTLIQNLRAAGHGAEGSTVTAHGRDSWRDYAAVRHPDDPVNDANGVGLGRRLLFQRVPETKTGKNRLHLDLHVGDERRADEVARLEALGATAVGRQDGPMGSWVVMTDPEGNEFRVA